MNIKRRDLREALQILVKSGWFLNIPYSKKVNVGEGKVDYSYDLIATDVFVSEAIKANAKRKGLKELNNLANENPDYVLPKPHGFLA